MADQADREVLQQLATTHSGLTSEQAATRLTRDGPNELPPPPRRSELRLFAGQLVHFFALMLWVAGGLAFLAGLPELGFAIFGVVILNGLFSFIQERRADRAAERLRSLLPRRVTVRRDGVRREIDARDVVVGDLLLLESGDRVPADARVLTAAAALVDTSMLTGESEPAAIERADALFGGTFVVEGEVAAEVSATGAATRLAAIARLTTLTDKPTTPLTRELHRVVRMVAVIAVGVGAAFFMVALLIGTSLDDGFVFAIGVTVALVPEALLPTVTLSLAWGAEQMAKRRVLVRHLEAVETLGSTTFICTDKTGTLTRNEMAIVEAWTPSGTVIVNGSGYEPDAVVAYSDSSVEAEIARVAIAGTRCSTGYAYQDGQQWRAHGDPMEAAIDVLARRIGVAAGADVANRDRGLVRFPFDARRRRMSVVDGAMVYVKGAPDAVLPLCVDGAADATAMEILVAKGRRVLAVAGRPAGVVPASAGEAECNLNLYGILALEDPPRDDVREAIAACRRAGIRVAMVTGDHPVTAGSIAAEVGLSGSECAVLSGHELPADNEALGALVDRDGVVVARVSPEDKLRIARALRARGHVVAMTGDGVNDGPALHEADIGIAMGVSGTDVAREAADLVLLDDHFATIVAGVEQGRATFVNVRRFLTYHLTDNVAELTPFVAWALSGGRFPLALGVLQILALDLGTDTFPAVALGAEPPAQHTLSTPPVSGRLLDRTVLRRAFGRLGPTEALLSIVAFVLSFVAAGWRPGDSFPEGHVAAAASGAAFITVVLSQMANAFACRSASHQSWTLGWTSNRLLLPALGLGLAISLTTLWFPPIADELGQANPPALGWLVALAAPAIVFAVDALDKSWRQRRHQIHTKRATAARPVPSEEES